MILYSKPIIICLFFLYLCTMAYSLDFRKQVFKVQKKENLSDQEVSIRFGISSRSLQRWKKRLEPITKRNKPATKINMEAFKKDVEENPDSYQYERAQKFGVSESAIYYALKRLKISNKKNIEPSQG